MTSAPHPQNQNTALAILSKLGAVVCFLAMATLIKIASAHVPAGEAVFFRSICGLPVILAWISLRGEVKTGLKTANPLGHFWRGVIGTLAMGMGFSALGLLPLSEVKAIQYAQPVLVVVFAAMFLGEPVRAFRLGAVTLGLVGVLMIMWPRLNTFADTGLDPYLALGAVLAFGSAIMAALAHVFIRKLTKTETTSAIVFWFGVTSASLSFLTLPFGWVIPSLQDALLLMAAGFIGGVGQILLTSSYRLADASIVAPFEYSSILLAIGVGYFIFGETPTMIMLFAIILIICAGIAIIWRERQLKLNRNQNRKSMTPQ